MSILIRNHLGEIIVPLSDLKWNIVIRFGNIVRKEIIKNWGTFN